MKMICGKCNKPIRKGTAWWLIGKRTITQNAGGKKDGIYSQNYKSTPEKAQ
ncbi:hypothetical protein LCGC14_2385690 [marine sediment metagenome]|uniref:Uncharacterized protein n=1 Tax=marine sediment metagenome TaxID=412755 RepID=A0A0F9CLT0_9ZZZZ